MGGWSALTTRRLPEFAGRGGERYWSGRRARRRPQRAPGIGTVLCGRRGSSYVALGPEVAFAHRSWVQRGRSEVLGLWKWWGSWGSLGGSHRKLRALSDGCLVLSGVGNYCWFCWVSGSQNENDGIHRAYAGNWQPLGARGGVAQGLEEWQELGQRSRCSNQEFGLVAVSVCEGSPNSGDAGQGWCVTVKRVVWFEVGEGSLGGCQGE